MLVVLPGPHGRRNIIKNVVAIAWKLQDEMLNNYGLK